MKNKILIIVLLVLTLIGIPITVYLLGQQQETRSRASLDEVPKQVKITNISDNSFTVSWITSSKVIGFIVFGKEQNSMSETVIDDRDIGGQQQKETHHVTLKNLDPQTSYVFKIGSGVNTYDNYGSLYETKTAPTTSDAPPVPKTLYGKVTNKGGLPPLESLIYAAIEGATPISTYTESDGNYLFTLNNARTEDLLSYKIISAEGVEVSIEVNGASQGNAKIKINSESPMPLQTLILGEAVTSASVASSITPSPTYALSPTPTLTTAPVAALTPTSTPTPIQVPLEIKSPAQGGVINNGNPKFTGTGDPGKEIIITVESETQETARVIVNPDGTWTYVPQKILENGEHKITISQNGQIETLTFMVNNAISPDLKPGNENIMLIILASGIFILSLGVFTFRLAK